MKSKKQLKDYYAQIKVEGILHSTIFGLSIGFFSGLLVFIIGIIITKNLLWIGFGISVFISLLGGVLLYLLVFRPSIKETAQRVDQFGLEERTITMVELENDDSFIAEVQRQNTKEVLGQHSLKLLSFRLFVKPLLVLLCVSIFMGVSLGFMINTVNASTNPENPVTTDLTDDEIFQEMIDDLLSIISNANIDVQLKSTLYGMVVDLEGRLPTYDTYFEKYSDVLQTRNEILQIIEDNILELEDSLINIAEALKKYDNTEVLGTALLTWDQDVITSAFEEMYNRIDVLLGQELYDVMEQTAIDIETALAESVGTDPAMAEALQHLADAYRNALPDFEAGKEQEMLADFKVDMDASRDELLAAVQALKDLVEELLELEDDIEEEVDQVDEFPMFMPYPDDGDTGDEPANPDTTSQNTVIDGVTPYESIYDDYYQDAKTWLTNEDLPEEIRLIIEHYFDMLD